MQLMIINFYLIELLLKLKRVYMDSQLFADLQMLIIRYNIGKVLFSFNLHFFLLINIELGHIYTTLLPPSIPEAPKRG